MPRRVKTSIEECECLICFHRSTYAGIVKHLQSRHNKKMCKNKTYRRLIDKPGRGRPTTKLPFQFQLTTREIAIPVILRFTLTASNLSIKSLMEEPNEK